MSQIIPSTEPFYFPGNEIGCLLIHGFTGTPKEMRWMGEYLAGQGYSVLGVRLAGHATSPADLQHTSWRDWVASVEDGWHLLSGSARCIFLCGLSMGGALSLYFAAQRTVAGIVAMSTPYDMPDEIPDVDQLIQDMPYIIKGMPNWFDQEALRDHISYREYPSRTLGELRELLAETRMALPNVEAPVLLMHSRQDSTVLPDHLQKIYNLLGSPDKRRLWLDDCGHVITRDMQRQRVFQEAAAFIHEICVSSR